MTDQTDLNHSAVLLRLDAPIDFRQLLHRCRGNEGLAKRIVASFQQKIDEDIALLEGALGRKDADQLAAVAHRVKGTAANVAAEGIREAAEEIELIARSGRFDQIPRWLVRFRSDGSRLAQILDVGEIRFDQGET